MRPTPTCVHCGRGRRQVELRPYGPGGAPICSDCANETPERKAEAQKQLRGRLATVAAPLPPALVSAAAAVVDRAAATIAAFGRRTVPLTCAKCAQPIADDDVRQVVDGRPTHAVCRDWRDALYADKAAKEDAAVAELGAQANAGAAQLLAELGEREGD